jgi:uncharacterized membrane protein YphA (DoxX/SURF4 family)
MKNIYFAFLAFIVPFGVSAHVGYVIDEADRVAHSGPDIHFLLSALTPFNIGLMVGTALLVLVAFFVSERSRWVKNWIMRIQARTTTYRDFLPWMLRLSLGIALIGAGSSEVFISPLLPAGNLISLFQIACGFLVLSGFLTGLATVGSIILYFIALSHSAYIIGNLDFLGIAIAILLFANSKPGMDDIFTIPFFPSLKKYANYAPVVARLGIGFAMTYLAIYEKFLNPEISELVVQKFNMTAAIPVSGAMWVLSAGIIELAVGLLLIIGFRPRLVSAVAFLVLTASFFFFKEAVYSHITLFGTLSVVFASGGKKFKTTQS